MPDYIDDSEFRILTEQTQQEIATIASKGLRGDALTPAEIKRVCGTALHHARQCYSPNRSMRQLGELVDDTNVELGLEGRE